MITYWSHLTSEQFAKLNKEKAMVIIPIGAIEQHGAHLPVGTDSIILETMLAKLVERNFAEETVIVAPLIPIGKSNEHMKFSGSLALSTQTVYTLIEDLATSFKQHGFTRIMLMNSHGGNTDLLNVISRDLRIKHEVEVYVFDWWFTTFWKDILEELQESGAYGVFHACELETSLMLAIAPSLVDMSKAVDETPPPSLATNEHISVLGPIMFGWASQDISTSGVIGTPSKASKIKGEKFLQYAVDKLEKMLKQVIQTSYIDASLKQNRL